MEFLIQNWYMIVLILIFIGGGTVSVIKFRKLTKIERYNQIQGWLLQAVLIAERDFGSGTGKLKLSSVYDKFCERFPWLAKIISFSKFSGYVDDALDEMKKVLEQNNAIASIVEPSSTST